MRMGIIATGLTLIFLVFVLVNTGLAINEVVISEILTGVITPESKAENKGINFQNFNGGLTADKSRRIAEYGDINHQNKIIKSKHGREHTNTLESIIELCNLYELTNNPLPLFCLNCGNGKLEPSEQCDDGNNSEYDGCNADCLLELPPSEVPIFSLELNA